MRLVRRSGAFFAVVDAQMRRQMDVSAHASIVLAPSRKPYQTAPLVLNGVVYVTTATGGVEALNGSDGKRLWQDDTTYLTHLVSNAG
jgi:outer membrane protein assembly factor BamB